MEFCHQGKPLLFLSPALLFEILRHIYKESIFIQVGYHQNSVIPMDMEQMQPHNEGFNCDFYMQIAQNVGLKEAQRGSNFSHSVDDLNSLCSRLLGLMSADEGPRLAFSGGVWVQKSFSLKPSFKETLNAIYRADVRTVDFQKEISLFVSKLKAGDKVEKEVNIWVAETTNRLIEELLPRGSIDISTLLFCLSMPSISRENGMTSLNHRKPRMENSTSSMGVLFQFPS
ncbi:putative serpin-Z4 [Cinnamomum micranthum f. kanehirae]|uniref:Putative serpin-Z4 n=1 Tax=Cinnamomum micranthum f. kanehirae TaxID=337451 RepID=A0A3S4NHK0_9MAGN|nr:putative serpin-Z4 [Cinnamomum micranthum f. kanehirae]